MNIIVALVRLVVLFIAMTGILTFAVLLIT